MPENSPEFIRALINSDYVDRERPMASRLLRLFDFDGPMFGVLDSAELAIVSNWLQGGLNQNREIPLSATDDAAVRPINPEMTTSAGHYAKLRNRELYHYLVNADLYPDALPHAHARAERLLRLCAWLTRLPFRTYSHQRFASFIASIYQREINAYHPLQGKPRISREAYVWGIEQIAPMILIDGCWLQNCQELQAVQPAIAEILFRIYRDEVGNGCLEHNHPYIFHKLLDSLAIKMPPVYSKEFTRHPGFIDSAFDLPVYMLALSSFPVKFLPELLGLNMAIELSGLGKGYMRLVDEWSYWGIDPTIAKVHISIDNYASGHTFLAKKAIQIYMDGISQTTGDPSLLDSHWRRIYSGYASLRLVGTRFRLSLPLQFLMRKLIRRETPDGG